MTCFPVLALSRRWQRRRLLLFAPRSTLTCQIEWIQMQLSSRSGSGSGSGGYLWVCICFALDSAENKNGTAARSLGKIANRAKRIRKLSHNWLAICQGTWTGGSGGCGMLYPGFDGWMGGHGQTTKTTTTTEIFLCSLGGKKYGPYKFIILLQRRNNKENNEIRRVYLVMGVLGGGGEGQNAGRSSRDAINWSAMNHEKWCELRFIFLINHNRMNLWKQTIWHQRFKRT